MQQIILCLALSVATAVHLACNLAPVSCNERSVVLTAHSRRIALATHRAFDFFCARRQRHTTIPGNAITNSTDTLCMTTDKNGNTRFFSNKRGQVLDAHDSVRCGIVANRGPSASSQQDTCCVVVSCNNNQDLLTGNDLKYKHRVLPEGSLKPQNSSRYAFLFKNPRGYWDEAKCGFSCVTEGDKSSRWGLWGVGYYLKTGLTRFCEHGSVLRRMLRIHGMSTLAWFMGLIFSACLSHVGIKLRLPTGVDWVVSAHRNVHQSLYSRLPCGTSIQQLVLGPFLEEVEFRLLLPLVLRHLWSLYFGRLGALPSYACAAIPLSEIIIRSTCAILFGIAHYIAPCSRQKNENMVCCDILKCTKGPGHEGTSLNCPLQAKAVPKKRVLQEGDLTPLVCDLGESQGRCESPKRVSSKVTNMRRSALRLKQESLQANRCIPLMIQSLIWGLAPFLMRTSSKMHKTLPLHRRCMSDPLFDFGTAFLLHVMSNTQITVLLAALMKFHRVTMRSKCGKTNK